MIRKSHLTCTWTKVVLPDPAIPSTKIHVGVFDCSVFLPELLDDDESSGTCAGYASAIVDMDRIF